MPDWPTIEHTVRGGERLDTAAGLFLQTTPDIARLGRLAHRRRIELAGREVGYVVNRHIDYSNVCVDSCLFCAFARRPGQEGAYEMSIEEVVRRADEVAEIGATELHMVGGLHPTWAFERYEGMLRAIRQRHPRMALKCFTAAEITHFSNLSGLSIEDVLRRLKEAGLSSLPGGGAEIFAERAQRKLFRLKGNADQWLAVHRTAHGLGLPTNATMLYGHIETHEERVDHLSRLRALQDETGGFLCFIPLNYHHENNRLGRLPEPTGLDILRQIACARLFLDNFRNIKAYWPMTGIETAQIALSFGANDIDGTVIEERIYHMAGAKTPQGLTTERLEALIREAGFEPVLRDAFHQPVATAVA